MSANGTIASTQAARPATARDGGRRQCGVDCGVRSLRRASRGSGGGLGTSNHSSAHTDADKVVQTCLGISKEFFPAHCRRAAIAHGWLPTAHRASCKPAFPTFAICWRANLCSPIQFNQLRSGRAWHAGCDSTRVTTSPRSLTSSAVREYRLGKTASRDATTATDG